MFKYDVCVIGGGGRVGLPLSIAFASKGLETVIYDIDNLKLEKISKGIMPFNEERCDLVLKSVVGKKLSTSDKPEIILQSKYVVVTIGTPVDEHLNPKYADMIAFFENTMQYFSKGQYIILRSTVYPGTTHKINDFLIKNGKEIHLAFCPERIAEGKALEELEKLPQIVSAFDSQCLSEVTDLFRKLTSEIIVLEPLEAELAKLFTNSWRYIQFATANQFYMLADRYNIDYYRIYNAMTYKYPRTQNFPKPGFAAGPCLFKDTMQLAAFSNNMFYLGHSAMLVNEGLPNYLVEKLKDSINLMEKNVGILGMAFKANSDDERESLSFKLKKILDMTAKKVYCSDPYIKRDYIINPEELIELSDIIILATPHEQYRHLAIPSSKILIDIWNFYGKQGVI